MVHGVYLRIKPNKKWLLMSVAKSAESAIQDLNKYVEKAKSKGNDRAEGAIKTFDSSFYVPEIIETITEGSTLFN